MLAARTWIYQKNKDEQIMEKNDAVGFYWEDLDFTVHISVGGNKQDEKKDDEKASANDELPPVTNNIRVQGRVVVRRHPTMRSETGVPLNVIYLKRTGNVLPHNWLQVTNTITQGVAHIMEGTKTRYFKDSRKNSGLATSAVSSLLCCSSGAAKKLTE